ncbi:MAG: hypothetical protein WCX29_00355 [Candidatus Peribacteraceae bacterium]|jgi:hypothetical protein
MQKTNISRTVVVIVGLLLFGLPVASVALLGSVQDLSFGAFSVQGEARVRAQTQRSVVRNQRRAYERALDDCRQERKRTGEDIPCPEINDLESYRAFIDDPLHGAAPLAAVPDAYSELDPREQAILEQYIALGRCPASLAVRGLYVRCMEALASAETPHGFLNDRMVRNMNAAMQYSNTLRMRLEQLVPVPRTYDPQSHSGSSIRRQ